MKIDILSAGAVEPGLVAALAEFHKQEGPRAEVTFNTAPQVRARIEKGETFDVVIVPPALMDAFAAQGRVGAGRVALGAVGQGLAVRASAPAPDVSTLEAMQRALLDAERVVFNRATGGQYIEAMLKRIGLYERLAPTTVRYDSAGQVMQHLARGAGREIGFGPITEIMLYTKKGVRYAGPLPGDVQHRNAYVASAMQGAGNGDAAAALLRFLATPAARAALTAGGVEP